MATARRTAFDILLAVEGGAHASDLLEERLRAAPSSEAGLATELVFGVLRRRTQLDWLLRQVVSRSLNRLDREVLASLRLGAYQLRFLDRIPDYSAVSESVELVKRAGKRSASGLVNAALRKLPALPSEWPDEETRYSMPAWILQRWRQQHGPEVARGIAEAALRRPDVFVRAPAWSEGLQPTGIPGGYRLISGDLPPGARYQDLGAQAIVPLLELQPGHRFLDLCAAPGNKTLQALEVPDLRVVACDISPRRLRNLLARDCPRVLLDATQPLPFGPCFDRILVDAPCSGTGTLARNPEIRWRLSPDDLHRHQERQKAILSQALKCLAPGGTLVYSTCSLEREENEEVVDGMAAIRRSVQRIPGRDDGEGFWAAVLSCE